MTFSWKCYLVLLSLILSVHDSWALGCSQTNAVSAATRFFSALDRGHIFSVPSRKQLPKIRHFVTPALYSQLQQASQAEEHEFARTKGKEPPIYEGSLFSSLAERYTSYIVATPTTTSLTIDTVAVKFQYIGNTPTTSTPYIWTDFVSVQTVSGKCLVSDMTFDSERPPTKLLSKTLKEISGG